MNLTERLEKLYTGAVHDVLRAMGHGRCTLPHEIKALDPTKKVAGEVYTVSGHIDQTRDPHDTLVQWTGLLSKAPPGKVLVCQPHTDMVALMGELSAETLLHKGVRGYVVDGGCRDTEFILKIGVPGELTAERVVEVQDGAWKALSETFAKDGFFSLKQLAVAVKETLGR